MYNMGNSSQHISEVTHPLLPFNPIQLTEGTTEVRWWFWLVDLTQKKERKPDYWGSVSLSIWRWQSCSGHVWSRKSRSILTAFHLTALAVRLASFVYFLYRIMFHLITFDQDLYFWLAFDDYVIGSARLPFLVFSSRSTNWASYLHSLHACLLRYQTPFAKRRFNSFLGIPLVITLLFPLQGIFYLLEKLHLLKYGNSKCEMLRPGIFSHL